VPGYRRYDAYPAPPSGDPAKAGQLLAGKTVPPLTYCFPNTPTDERVANGVKAGLERAGLRIDLNAVDGSKYEATTGRPDNACDLIDGGWGMDYPDARTVFEPLFSEVRPSGNTNLSYLDDPKITAAIAALGAQPDRAQAARGYADLDKRLMTEQAPLIPAAYERYFALIGSKVGGAHLSPLYGQTSLVDLFVT
jgi:peptide/nickel transport system substrate-binding protein